MESYSTVEAYLEAQNEWRSELDRLREIILKTELVETVKWGVPCYTINGKNVVGIGAFKSYVGLWFFQGVFLQDAKKVLINAQEGTTKGMRQWRFNSTKEMEEPLMLDYLKEAIQNQKDGKMIKAEKKPLIIPELLQTALNENQKLAVCFEQFTLSKKREFTEHIASAKQEKTKLSRLDKIIPMILNNIGLHDKYRNC